MVTAISVGSTLFLIFVLIICNPYHQVTLSIKVYTTVCPRSSAGVDVVSGYTILRKVKCHTFVCF